MIDGDTRTMWHYSDERVLIRKICVGSWENNVYVVACAASNAAVIVDAAAEPSTILRAVAGLDVQAVLTTHGHFDHVGAAGAVAEELGVPWRLHPADSEPFGLRPDAPLDAGQIALGDTTITALHTPGHTPGSMCLVVDGVVLTGDTLFPGGPGATRGPGSSFDSIMESLDLLFALPPSTLVMPGHGLDTTIGTEAPHAAAWRARGW